MPIAIAIGKKVNQRNFERRHVREFHMEQRLPPAPDGRRSIEEGDRKEALSFHDQWLVKLLKGEATELDVETALRAEGFAYVAAVADPRGRFRALVSLHLAGAMRLEEGHRFTADDALLNGVNQRYLSQWQHMDKDQQIAIRNALGFLVPRNHHGSAGKKDAGIVGGESAEQ